MTRNHNSREAVIAFLAMLLPVLISNANGEIEANSSPRIAIVVGPKAPALERLAASELQTILRKLFEIDVVVRNSIGEGDQAVILLGSPVSNPVLAERIGRNWPKLTDQGLILRRLKTQRPSLVVGGGSPVATLWSAYELGERLGVRYLLDRDVYPPKRKWDSLPTIDVVMEPNMRIRCWRLVNDLPNGPVSWSLAENRRFLRQMAKMKYNRIHTALWPGQPNVHYSFRGMDKPPGSFYFGLRHPIDNDTIGRSKFKGMKYFTNPELVGADSPEEIRKRSIGIVRGILQEARRLGMETGLSIQPFEWPKEFMKVLPGSEPVHQLGGLTAGPGSKQSMDDPLLRDMVATIMRAYLETYPNVDYLHVSMPEHRSWIGQAKSAFEKLSTQYQLEDLGSYEELCARARSRTSFPGGGKRVETMLKGDLSSIWFFDSLMKERKLLKRPEGRGDVKLVYNGVVAELFPLLGRMVPPGGEVLSFIDYTASRQLRQRSLLKQVPPKHVPASLIFTLADDNVGVLPQLATGSLHSLMGELRQNGWAGFYTRYWTIGDLDPTIHYLARSSWNISVTPQKAYADQVEHVCGPAAVKPALEAFRIVEKITIGLDQHGLGFGFPVPGMMTKHYHPGGLSAALRDDHRQYRQALSLMEEAHLKSRPEGHAYTNYFVARLRFAVHYLDAAEAFGATAGALKSKHQVVALKHAETAVTAIREALEAYVAVARDHGDLGAVALMNEYCYRPIRDKRNELRSVKTN